MVVVPALDPVGEGSFVSVVILRARGTRENDRATAREMGGDALRR